MRQLDKAEFDIRLIGPGDDLSPPNSEIILNGETTGKILSGAVLEVALEWQGRYLVFTTDDIPQEDALGIHYLDEQLDSVDGCTLGGIYSTGTFGALQLVEPNRVTFRFIGGVVWTVELLDQPAFRLPWISEPRGVHRPFGFTRHFKVHSGLVEE